MSKESRATIERMAAAAWLRLVEYDHDNAPDPCDEDACYDYLQGDATREIIFQNWLYVIQFKHNAGITGTRDEDARKMLDEARAIITERQIKLTSK